MSISETGRTASEWDHVGTAFRTLSRLYLEPITTESDVRQLRDWMALVRNGTTTEEIQAALGRMETLEVDTIDQIHRDFTHLFRGVHSSQSVKPPYESLYREGALYGSTTVEIKRGFDAIGVEFTAHAANEPPDHLGIELEFLANLCELEGDESSPVSASRVRDAQLWLLDEHLLEWVPTFSRVLREAPATTEFYRGVVELTLALLESHRASLAEEWE
jgi:TorA maturation chaperone TorD